jgi:hypothetical protein
MSSENSCASGLLCTFISSYRSQGSVQVATRLTTRRRRVAPLSCPLSRRRSTAGRAGHSCRRRIAKPSAPRGRWQRDEHEAIIFGLLPKDAIVGSVEADLSNQFGVREYIGEQSAEFEAEFWLNSSFVRRSGHRGLDSPHTAGMPFSASALSLRLSACARSIAAVRKSAAGKFVLTGGIFAARDCIRALQKLKTLRESL